MGKPRILKDYDKLSEGIKEQIKLFYPYGFEDELIEFKNAQDKMVSALSFETEDTHYLVRMTVREARAIIDDDDDYDEGVLKEEIKAEYEEKYEEEEEEKSPYSDDEDGKDDNDDEED